MDLNILNQLYGEHQSPNIQGTTQQAMTRTSGPEIKQLQHLVSPANIPFNHRSFILQSPTPFRATMNFYQQDQSQQHDHPQNFSNEGRRNTIKTPLEFDESPKKKTSQLNTAYTHRFSSKNSQQSLFSSNSKQDKKNSKGLRNLSESVYKIVIDMGVTTYKEVADHLVRKLNAGQFGPLDEGTSKSKDQQNIKRRVYDALNVLISAGVLKKSGKEVTSSHQDVLSQKTKISNRNGKKQDKQNLQEQILRKQQIIKEKRQKIQQMKSKIQILNAVMKRNRKKKVLQKEKIEFPIVAFAYKKTIPKLIRNQTSSKVSLPSMNLIEVIADMDLLMKVGIDVLNQNIQQIIQQVNSDEQAQQNLSLKKKAKSEQVVAQSRQKVSRVLYTMT